MNNMLLNKQCVREELKEEIKKFLETNKDSSTTYQKFWDIVKAVLGGKFITIGAHIKKQGRQWVNELSIQLRELEKNNKTTPKAMQSIRLSIREEINRDQKNTYTKSMNHKVRSLKK